MSNGLAHESRKWTARLPLVLILLTIAGLAGLVLWLSLAPPPPAPRSAVQISLVLPPAEPAAPVAPQATAPAADAPALPAAAGAPALPAAGAPAMPVAGAPVAPKLSPALDPLLLNSTPPSPDPLPAAPKLPPIETTPALSEAPEPGLIERSRHGPLPIVGRDGREAWRVYAGAIDKADKKSRITVVLHGLGMNAAATRSAIRNLPGAISLAFTPYADGLDGWIAEARAAGHEALMMVPMEVVNFPISDPGPRALLTSLSAAENIDRLEWVLARATGYVGVTEYLGSRFIASSLHMEVLFKALRERGLLFLAGDQRVARMLAEIAEPLRLPFAVSTLYIDNSATRGRIVAQLAELERLAGTSGQAIGMGFPYPITIKLLANWAVKLKERGFTLTPLSALTTRSGS